jgi:cyclopropane-fatty-acyl-phospholipid synthase
MANKEQAIAIAGIRTWRLWRLYMAGSAYFFNKGNLGLYQILAGKNRHPWPLPLSRAHLYR